MYPNNHEYLKCSKIWKEYKQQDSNRKNRNNFETQLYNTDRLSVSRCGYKTESIKDGVNTNETHRVYGEVSN